MRGNRFFAHTLTRFTMISLLLLVSCRAKSPSQSQTAVPPLPAEVPGTADRYSVLIMGNPAGQQAVWTAPDGQLHIFFQFNDRGRGPQTTSVLKLDAKVVPVAENIIGNNYYKSPVRENFATVRDLGNDIDTLLARHKRIEEGKEIGTRIVLAGIIDGPGPYQGPTKVLVSTKDEARAAVDNYVQLGYVQIKIYSSVKPELVPAIIDEAHKRGLRVSGHIPAGMTAAQCVELGYDEIQHVNFLMLNFMPDVKDTNTSSRLTVVGQRGADLDLNSPQVQSFIKLLQDHHTVLDPTLSIFEDMLTTPPGKLPRGDEAIAERLPPQVRRGLLSSGLTPPAGMEARYPQSFTRMMELIGMMYRAEIPMEAGTDSMAGFALLREFELHVQAGIPANRVLQDATFNAARIMKLDHDLGSIAPGKLADLTLVNGDPTENISDIRKTAVVVKDGIVYKPQELYAAIGVAP